jgi:hypothetical protein
METFQVLPTSRLLVKYIEKREDCFRRSADEAYFRLNQLLENKLKRFLGESEFSFLGKHLFPIKAVNMEPYEDEFPAILIASYDYPKTEENWKRREEARIIHPELVIDLRQANNIGTYISVADRGVVVNLIKEDSFRLEVFSHEISPDGPPGVYVLNRQISSDG